MSVKGCVLNLHQLVVMVTVCRQMRMSSSLSSGMSLQGSHSRITNNYDRLKMLTSIGKIQMKARGERAHF